MEKTHVMRIDPNHVVALRQYLNTYYGNQEAHWHFRHVEHDSFQHLDATRKIRDLAHAFQRGRESMT